MNLNRRDLSIFVLGAAAGMFFMISWASRNTLAPWLSSFVMAQITAMATLGAGIWLWVKK